MSEMKARPSIYLQIDDVRSCQIHAGDRPNQVSNALIGRKFPVTVRSRIKQGVCTHFTRVITLNREPPYAQ
jgi:hypothetical protein